MRRFTFALSSLAAVVALGAGNVAYGVFTSATSNPGGALTAALNFCTGGFTPYWMDGLEQGAISGSGKGTFDATTAGLSADSSMTHSGNYSMKVTDNATNASYHADKNTAAATLVLRFAIRFDTLPAGSLTSTGLIVTTPGSGNLGVFGFNLSTGKFTWGADTGTPAFSTDPIVAGRWYIVDLKEDHSVSPTTYDWTIDGTAQPRATHGNNVSSVLKVFWGGGLGTGAQFVAYFDDMVISATAADYPIGDGAILATVPDGTPSVTNPASDFTPNDATSWNTLAEVPITTNDYVEQTVDNVNAYMSLSLADTARTCIQAVTATVGWTSSTTGANLGKTAIWDAGTERVVFSGDMSASTTVLQYGQAVISPAGGAWTPAKFNALTARIGYGTAQPGNPRWQGLVVQYATSA